MSAKETVAGWQKYTLLAGPYAGPYNEILSLAFNPHDPNMLASSSNGKIHLWNINQSQNVPIVLMGANGAARVLAFNLHDPTMLASGLNDNTICLWDVSQPQKEAIVLKGHKGGVNALAFSPHESTLLASGSDDTTIRLWKISKPHQNQIILQGHRGIVTSLVFNQHDPSMLVSGSDDNTIRLWDIKQPRKYPIILKGHNGGILSLAFSRQNPMMIASCSNDGTIRIWNIHKRRELRIISIGNVHCTGPMEFNPNNPTMFAVASFIRINLGDINQPNKKPLVLKESWLIESLAFNQHNPSLLASGSCDGAIRMWDITDTSGFTQESNTIRVYFQDKIINNKQLSQKNYERWLLIGLDHLHKQHPDNAAYEQSLKSKISKNHIQKTLAGLPEPVQNAFIAKYKLHVLQDV